MNKQSINCLVVNCGSSSIKVACYELPSVRLLYAAEAEELGDKALRIVINDLEEQSIQADSTLEALRYLLETIQKAGITLQAIAHRVVHGGEHFSTACVLDQAAEQELQKLSAMAPLHNPINLMGIDEAKRAFPELPHIACFDTSFYSELPLLARTYAIPRELSAELALRRFGFHGISHQFVLNETAAFMQTPREQLNIISCHLGSGCSLTAIREGRAVDTSMGFTPLEGLIMRTRCGDIDPGLLLYLLENHDRKTIKDMLYTQSGLKALAGGSGDMREVLEAAGRGNDQGQFAFEAFTYRLLKYIGAYSAVLGRLDALVFTAGIGENCPELRASIAGALQSQGVHCDFSANAQLRKPANGRVASFAEQSSEVQLLVVWTDEQQAIAQEAARLLLG